MRHGRRMLTGAARVTRRMTLAEAAAKADELARDGADRERAVAYRAVGQFRFRQKTELLRRGLEDDSPAARGSALVSIQLLSKEHPGVVNQIRPILHTMAAGDPNQAVRRLAIVCLRNGSPQRETIVLLSGLAEADDQEPELRNAARAVAAELRKRSSART
jgi:HEAT repeat protein